MNTAIFTYYKEDVRAVCDHLGESYNGHGMRSYQALLFALDMFAAEGA